MEREFNKIIICQRCGKQFDFTRAEQEFFQQKGFSNPKYCSDCRSIRRNIISAVCAGCGKNLETRSKLYCANCLEAERLKLEIEVKALTACLNDAKEKLNTVEADKIQMEEVMNQRITENTRLFNEMKLKLSVLETEKAKILHQDKVKLSVAESEKANLTTMLDHEKQMTAQLQDKCNSLNDELKKELRYRAQLDNLEPKLNDFTSRLEMLGRNQEDVKQAVIELINNLKEIGSNHGILVSLKRIFGNGHRSSSSVN